MNNNNNIRNFCIIAHIDHGKSTLADRFLLYTGAISQRESKEQLLDDMDLERERGITIKASVVRINYKTQKDEEYVLNLIDTPGHVDFTYEVSKSLAACEGAILLVDAGQGVQAQTVANLYMALERNLVIVPVINKIDLPSIDIDDVKKQILNILGLDEEEILLVSAKGGIGIKEVLQKIIDKVPPPHGNDNNPLQALVVDSQYDSYKGVIIYIRLFNGVVRHGDQIKMMGTNKVYEVQEVGVFKPQMSVTGVLKSGEVGFITCNIREPKDVHVGDTVTNAENPCLEMLPGYKKVTPMVYSGIYPINSKDFPGLRDAMEKLKLTDASFGFEPESSPSLGFGFRCGFLGLLHMEIIQERLEREYGMNIILTTPNVVYLVMKTDGTTIEIDSPTKLPDISQIKEIQEPMIKAHLILPTSCMGTIMELSKDRRGEFIGMEYLSNDRVRLGYYFPLSEILVDFYDKVKSMSKGYGSVEYELHGYKTAKLVKLDVLINGELCDALSSIVHKDHSYTKGKALVEKLREVIPRQMFDVAIQAAIGAKIIARETVKAVKKNVTAKCYGGDISRKRKLWDKQKEGKKRMKQFGKVQIPQEAFMSILKI